MVGERNTRQWTNRSVQRFAGSEDPIALVSKKAREIVLEAVQVGWSGPPFDPFGLAKILRIPTIAREDVLDARLTLSGAQLRIEFNPNQPRRRTRFSVAHELAHTMFPDCVEATRHRGKSPHAAQDDWQLELLCNIAAAEILMPTGMEIDPHTPINSETMLRLQSQFDVSMEAVANRLASVSRKPFTIVVAARADENEKVPKYRVDYVRPSRTSQITLSEGLEITSQVFAQCTAVGYTAKGREKVSGDSPELDWECIGVPPYPGKKFPRVVGIASLRSSRPSDAPSLVSVRGNALEPRGARPWIIAQIVNDKAQIWGAGFAKAVGIKFPEAQADFIEWARNSKNLSLGNVHAYEVSSDLTIFSMIAQHGYGESELPRIRYAALRKCLEQLGNFARDHSASVHMPRIGTGYAGGNWSFIVELIDETIVRMGTRATVYTPADREPIMTKHVVALTSDRWKDAYG